MAVEQSTRNGIRKKPSLTELSATRNCECDFEETPVPESHSECLLCGKNNPLSLGLRFRSDGKGAVWTEVQLSTRLQGYSGILHGGVISSLLDAAMTHSLFHAGIEAVTGDLRVRFVHPVPCGGIVAVRSWILTSYPPLYSVRAELLVQGQVVAWGEGKFARRPENS